MLRAQASSRPIRLVEFIRAFYLGGTEGQALELLRKLPDDYTVRVAVLDKLGPLLTEVRALGHEPEAFPLRGSVMKPNTALQVARMAHWLHREKVDLVHAHDFYAAVVAVPAALLAGVKVIVGRLDLAHWHSKLQRAVLAEWTRRAHHVIANARAIERMLVTEEHVDPRRITVIPNGIDVAAFDARAKQGLYSPLPEADGPVVLHVANMNHVVKRQEDVLVALSILKQRGVKLHAFFVGDGPRRPLLERHARLLAVEDRAHFLGHRKDVPAIWLRADLGVLCSTAEGTSNAIMEGMAAARPMVVTGVGGSPDLIADGERGLVVRPERPIELANAFGRLLQDAETARRFGAAARTYLARELTLDRLVERHDALYRRVLGRGEGRRDAEGDPRDRAPLARAGAAVPLGDDARV